MAVGKHFQVNFWWWGGIINASHNEFMCKIYEITQVALLCVCVADDIPDLFATVASFWICRQIITWNIKNPVYHTALS